MIAIDEGWNEVKGQEVEDVERVVIRFEKPGDEFIGIYEGSFEFDGSFGPSVGYNFRSCADEDIQAIIWGSTVLNTKLGKVEPGRIVRIVYEGVKKSQRGGRGYKDFRVFDKAP